MTASLEDIQDALLDRIHAGEAIDREAELARHPEHAEALAGFFQVLDLVEGGADEDAPPPAGLGEFRVVREIGRGGMGVVYEAEQTSLKRRVALKVLPPMLRMDARLVTRFRREAEAAARLRHPGIVPVFSVGEAAGTPFFAMELVDGVSLQQVVERRRRGEDAGLGVPEEQWTAWATETIAKVAEALAHAHAHGILHRDVKPANILVDRHGAPRLTDFGLAQDLRSPGLTQTGEVFGSPQYMSPEQAIRRDVPVDERTDVYSLAVTLYELLTCRLPYEGTTTAELLTALAGGKVVPPRKIVPAIPRAIEQVLLCALDRDPRRRHRGAQALADDLRAALAGRPLEAQPVHGTRRLVVLGALALCLAGAGAFALFGRRGGTEPSAATPTAPAAITGAFYDRPLADRLEALLADRPTALSLDLPLAFWLDLQSARRSLAPAVFDELLGRVLPDADLRRRVLELDEQGREVAARFSHEWNENWSDDAEKARYDALFEALRRAGPAAVPTLLDILGRNPYDAFWGQEDAAQVSARMQVRALLACAMLEVEEVIPFCLIHAAGPSLTLASNASVTLQRLTGEDFDAQWLKDPDLAKIEWWALGSPRRVVGVNAAAEALLRELDEGIDREMPGMQRGAWWNDTGAKVVADLERVLGRRIPFESTPDPNSQHELVRRMRRFWETNRASILD